MLTCQSLSFWRPLFRYEMLKVEGECSLKMRNFEGRLIVFHLCCKHVLERVILEDKWCVLFCLKAVAGFEALCDLHHSRRT